MNVFNLQRDDKVTNMPKKLSLTKNLRIQPRKTLQNFLVLVMGIVFLEYYLLVLCSFCPKKAYATQKRLDSYFYFTFEIRF